MEKFARTCHLSCCPLTDTCSDAPSIQNNNENVPVTIMCHVTFPVLYGRWPRCPGWSSQRYQILSEGKYCFTMTCMTKHAHRFVLETILSATTIFDCKYSRKTPSFLKGWPSTDHGMSKVCACWPITKLNWPTDPEDNEMIRTDVIDNIIIVSTQKRNRISHFANTSLLATMWLIIKDIILCPLGCSSPYTYYVLRVNGISLRVWYGRKVDLSPNWEIRKNDKMS